jgi:hypothetical protein
LSALVATFSFFRFTPGLAFGEKDIGYPAITEYLSFTGQGKLRNRKKLSERKQTFYGTLVGNFHLLLIIGPYCYNDHRS